jgi:hypothetical protein
VALEGPRAGNIGYQHAMSFENGNWFQPGPFSAQYNYAGFNVFPLAIDPSLRISNSQDRSFDASNLDAYSD